MKVIEAENIGVTYRLLHDKRWTLKKSAMSVFRKKPPVQAFWALREVSFRVNEGEILGIIGKNGSGKTTLLRVIGGIIRPDEGSIRVRGDVSTLLSINAGFQPELSGLENIYINGAILGLKRKEIDAVLGDIVGFSELNDFIDIPVKAYSSGMHARLGFSIAVNIQRDVTLIDEILGVGDKRFREKCGMKMRQFKEQGRTMIVVSHDIETIKSFCTRAVFLDRGMVKARGPAEEVVEEYLKD
jgi:ABC-type polysaccharide/polyol phosphate transport system ATPase subunit